MFRNAFIDHRLIFIHSGMIACALLFPLMFSCAQVVGDDKEVLDKLDASFREMGMRRSGVNLMFVEEAELKKHLDSEKSIRNEMKKMYPGFQAMEQEDHIRTSAIPNAYERIIAIDQLLAQNLPVTQHNQLVTERNTLQNQINRLRSDKQWPEQLKQARAEFNSVRERYIENLLEARKVADDLEKRWTELESDISFKKLTAELGKELKQSVAVGPSRTLRKMLSDLDKLEENVLSDVIPLQSSGGNTFTISVTVNGKVTVDMVLDSGAGIISLPAATAEKLGLSADASSPDVRLVLADGRTVTAKLITIPVVRVGRFEAKDVEAAILPSELTNAEPLLGMSFLKNFQFKVDSDAKTLTMAEVEMDDRMVDRKKSSPKDKKK